MNKQGKNGIPYCDYTWNPVVGCNHTCSYCFARRIATRFEGSKAFPNGFQPTFHRERLSEVKKIKKPSRIFVSDMGDLFGDWVPAEWVDKVLAVINDQPQHSFLFLTKNPKRYQEFSFPSNAWLGTSVENQAAADERIPLLLQTPAAVRFISAEPLLGPVDLTSIWKVCPECGSWEIYEPRGDTRYCDDCGADVPIPKVGIDWVITGGESGPGARPVHPDWVSSLRDQCQAASVPFFFKQWGKWKPIEEVECGVLDDNIHRHSSNIIIGPEGVTNGEGWNGTISSTEMIKDKPLWHLKCVGKKKAGRELDGRTWNEMPEVGGNA